MASSPSLKAPWWRWLSDRVPVLDYYIIQELLPPFLFGVGAFTSIGIAIGALFELVRQVTEAGLPISTAMQVFFLKLPDFLVLSFPMAVLLSTLMTYGRLSSDSELIALRSCGISVYRIVLPAIVMSLVVTGLTFVFNEFIVPAANYRATLTLQQALNQERPPFQEKNIFYQEFGEVKQPEGGTERELVRIFYARRFDGTKMKGLTILDFSERGLNQIVTAERATWNMQDNTWDFSNGTIYLVSADGSYRNIIKFEDQQLKLPRTPLDLASRGRDYGEMSIAQAQERLALLRQGNDENKIRKLEVRIQQKYAFPFVCVVFGLVGSALGTRPQRASKSTSFGISVLLIFGYYLLAFISGSLGQLNILSPFLAAWLPIGVTLGVGILFLMRAAR